MNKRCRAVFVSLLVLTIHSSYSYNYNTSMTSFINQLGMSYTPYQENSFLAYMMQLRDTKSSMTPSNSSSTLSRLDNECVEYRHGFSRYFQLVYQFLCGDKATTDFCKSGADDRLCSLTERVIAQPLPLFWNRTVYKELILEDVSFCTPVVCPYVNKESFIRNFSLPFSLYDCMPDWCRAGFYLILVVDIILSILISFTNVFVLNIGRKYSFLATPGG